MTFTEFSECTGVTAFDQVYHKDAIAEEKDFVYYGGWQLVWVPGGEGGVRTVRKYRLPGGGVQGEFRTSQRVLTEINKW
ncbi:MAG TPA: hypothetical protein VGM19_08845 [Armatimonadota bacterium]|jgi:hypothetical protein